jgi:hypothetical protein
VIFLLLEPLPGQLGESELDRLARWTGRRKEVIEMTRPRRTGKMRLMEQSIRLIVAVVYAVARLLEVLHVR